MELIAILGSQPAGGSMHSHEPGGGLPPPPARHTATHMHFINPAVGRHYLPPEPPNKKLSYRKETVRLLHNVEIRVLHYSHIVRIAYCDHGERRLTFRRVIIEKWMYIARVPLDNALVLDHLCEYRHK